MPNELKNAHISFVSYVDKAANKKQFFLTKSEDQPNFQFDVKIITKADDPEMLVYGIVYEPDTVDSQGDFMTAEEIEKAAHGFLKDARNIDTQHDFQAGVGEVVESYVAPADFTVGDQTITKGSWVLVTKASPEVWDNIQKGEITGYSMAGTAERTPVAKEEEQLHGFFNTLKAFFTKGEVKDKFNAERKQREFRDAYWIFDDIFWTEIWSDTPNVQRIRDAAQDFGELLIDIANSPDVMKALGDIPKGDKITVKKEELTEIMKEVLTPALADVTQRLEALEKGDKGEGEETPAPEAGDVQKAEGEAEKADLVKAFQEIVKAEMNQVNERIDAIAKARSLPNANPEGEQEDVTKSQDSIWSGLL